MSESSSRSPPVGVLKSESSVKVQAFLELMLSCFHKRSAEIKLIKIWVSMNNHLPGCPWKRNALRSSRETKEKNYVLTMVSYAFSKQAAWSYYIFITILTDRENSSVFHTFIECCRCHKYDLVIQIKERNWPRRLACATRCGICNA